MARGGDMTETCTTCPYCGVGCGVIALQNEQGEVSVKGDETHPANFGKLCSKGSALAETLGDEDRLLFPQVKGERVSWDSALDQIAETLSKTVETYGPDSVAFYVSGQLMTEDYYIANKFMKGFIGSGNIDTNSRLCMASSVVGHKRAFGADIVPGCYEDLEEADLLVLTGSNLAWCHPILYQRILAAKQSRPHMKIVVIDPRRTASCDLADLHLPLAPGSDVSLFMGLFAALERAGVSDVDFIANHTDNYAETVEATKDCDLDFVAQSTGVSKADISEFYKLFARTEKTVTVYSQGVNQAKDGTDKVNAIINCHLLTGRIGKVGAGPFSVTGQPNAMGGREVGGLANQLASHMDIANDSHLDIVERFWNAPNLARQQGLKAVDLFEAAHAGDVKVVWIMATNPVDSMPNANRVRAALERCDLVIVSDIYGHTDTAACADIVLPSTGWGEKDGTVTNSERRISRQRRFLPALGEARDDWWQFCEVAKRMGFEDSFSYGSVADIFREYAGLCSFENDGTRDLDLSAFLTISEEAYNDLSPIQWPVNGAHKSGLKRFFEDHKYFTNNGKAHFIPITRGEIVVTSQDYPFVLNTGRLRDQWHSMTRTGRAARLSQHISEPFVEIHPTDAARLNLQTATIATLRTPQGEMQARVILTENQRQGSVFVPMHFTDRFARAGRVDALTHDIVDPLSGQPALKSTLVSIQAYKVEWYGFAVLAADIFEDVVLPDAVTYWAKARVENGVRIELAGEKKPDNWDGFFAALINQSGEFEILQMSGSEAGQIRLACFLNDKLVALFITDVSPVAVSRQWASSQLSKSFTGGQRHRILAGRPGADMPDKGAIICSCMNVGMNEIRAAISAGCNSLPAIGTKTQAGTNCGSCQSEIRSLLKEMSLATV